MVRLIVNSNAHNVAIGYVGMSSKEEAVQAMQALDGYTLFARPIRVGPSTTPFAKVEHVIRCRTAPACDQHSAESDPTRNAQC